MQKLQASQKLHKKESVLLYCFEKYIHKKAIETCGEGLILLIMMPKVKTVLSSA